LTEKNNKKENKEKFSNLNYHKLLGNLLKAVLVHLEKINKFMESMMKLKEF
jgi:hypothetical protein